MHLPVFGPEVLLDSSTFELPGQLVEVKIGRFWFVLQFQVWVTLFFSRCHVVRDTLPWYLLQTDLQEPGSLQSAMNRMSNVIVTGCQFRVHCTVDIFSYARSWFFWLEVERLAKLRDPESCFVLWRNNLRGGSGFVWQRVKPDSRYSYGSARRGSVQPKRQKYKAVPI